MLRLARGRIEATGLAHAEVRRGDMYALPRVDHSVDTVVLHQVLHFADDPAAVIAEAARVVGPGGGVLVVGPSNVFMNYIERVLPSLGEDAVTLKSIGSVATDVLGMASERVDRSAAASLKGSLRMLTVLRRLIRRPLIDGPEVLQVRVTVKGEVLRLTPPELHRIRDSVLSHTKLNKGREQARNMVISALAAKLSDDVDVPAEEVPGLIEEQGTLAMFMNAWWRTLDARGVLAGMEDGG